MVDSANSLELTQEIILGFVAVLVIFLGILSVIHNRGRSNILFFTFSTITFVWIVTNIFTGLFRSVGWLKVNFSVGSLMVVSVLWWSHYFLQKGKNDIWKIFFITFLSSVFSVVPYWGHAIINKVVSVHVGRIDGSYGPGFYAYSLYQIAIVTYLFVRFLLARKKATSRYKIQINYVMLGIFGFGVIPVIFSLILPIFGVLIFAGIDSFGSLILIGAIFYAIIRHRLLDIRLVISRSILYVALLATVSLLFILAIFLTGTVYASSGGLKWLITFLSSFIIVFGLDPLKRAIAFATDKIFFKAPIDYTEVLRILSERISTEVELGKLTHELSQDITRELKIHHTEILLSDEKGNLCRRDETSGAMTDCIPANNDLARYLRSGNKIVERDGLERRMEDTKHEDDKTVLGESLKSMDALVAAIAVPITAQGKMNAALILGKKLAGDAFSGEELRLLTVLGPQIGSAIQKAKLYEEVKSFTVKLQIEVDRATKELKERNRFLVALQDLTSLITHSLDYKKVTQEIVDGIAKKLGYIGGILMLVNKQTGVTWAEAVTQTALTSAAFKLLPIPISSFRGNIADPDLASQSMRSGQVTESADLADFLNPPIPSPICHAMQKLTHIKYIVSVPIVSEDQIVGCIVYTIGKEKKDISNSEEAMMKALADQAGIVLNNLHLFQQIEKANQDLATANDHLKILDESKSEFISIASHQLRTPMTGIMGYLSMITSGDFGKVDPALKKILENILAASKRMIRLINIFLNISKIEAGRFEIVKKPTQIEDIIETEFVELSKLAENKKLGLKFDKPEKPLPLVPLDRDKLSDVIQNLIDNAIKYTDAGSVTVTPEIFGSELIVRVKDTGRGIAKDEVDKLFNKFVRGDGIARIHPDGSGLGLFIAKKIVEAHGGRIWVESEGEGKGSSFIFAIPIANDADLRAQTTVPQGGNKAVQQEQKPASSVPPSAQQAAPAPETPKELPAAQPTVLSAAQKQTQPVPTDVPSTSAQEPTKPAKRTSTRTMKARNRKPVDPAARPVTRE